MIQNWRFWWCIVIPVVFSPLIIVGQNDDPKLKCAYVILIMASFWMVEALPVSITSLLPVALFPFLGLQSTSQVVSNYMRESGMMFVGGISLAIGIEYSGLHKRIAIKTLLLIGTSPWRLLLGVLLTTFFLSFWVVSTSAAAMMVPIVTGLVDAFDVKESDRRRLSKLFFLAAGYGANVGGTAVIIGSSANLIYRDLVAEENIGQNGKYTDINFATWIAFNLPIAFINLFLVWGVLGYLHLKRKGNLKEEVESQCETEADVKTVKRNLRRKLDSLGRMTFHEKAVSVIFAATIILWFTRDPQIFPGWQELLFPSGKIKIGDSSVAIFMVVVMFSIPKDLDNFKLRFGRRDENFTPTEALMSWKYLVDHFPWNVVFLMGGGFAISDGAQTSGLSDWVGQQMLSLESLPKPIILLIILLVLSLLTEFTSNGGTVSLLTPILFALSRDINLHPAYLSLPGVIVCQYAFMLPTSNPSNAIVFGAGNLKIMDMVKPGVILNFLCLIVLFLMNISWGQFMFKFNDYEYPLVE